MTDTLHIFSPSSGHRGIIVSELLRSLRRSLSSFLKCSLFLSWASFLFRAPRAAAGWIDWLRCYSCLRLHTLDLSLSLWMDANRMRGLVTLIQAKWRSVRGMGRLLGYGLVVRPPYPLRSSMIFVVKKAVSYDIVSFPDDKMLVN